MKRYCPVCWQTARPTHNANICGHWDTIRRDICPGSSQPFLITLIQPVKQGGTA